jgi:phosphoglycerate kinase
VAILGGAMASTFLKLQGVRVCKSPVENDKLGLAKSLLAKPGNKLMLPVDHVVVNEVKQGAANEVVDTIAEGQIGADIGQRKERIP